MRSEQIAPVELAFLNNASGTIGEVSYLSMRTNATTQPRKPAIVLPEQLRFLQPRLVDSMNPFTMPPSPGVAGWLLPNPVGA